MRKFSILLAVAVVASVLFLLPGIALGNMAIHGGYSEDTDSCAGCHRAHTATSSITWFNGTEERSALLISTAEQQFEFCFTCHGSEAAGAATNVWDGVYEGTAHGTNGAQLNSGAFSDDVVGMNKHTYNGGSWGAWGGGNTGNLPDDPAAVLATGTGAQIVMTCGSCHDVHGSSNYRLLKDMVGPDPQAVVGGYLNDSPTNPTPQPFVISNEEGYPQEGWRLGDAGAAQMDLYVPNYTEPKYAKAPALDTSKGMSGWCSGCHTQYMNESSVYNANDSFDFNQWGFVTRHRHPVNSELGAFNGARDLNLDLIALRRTQGTGLPTAWADGESEDIKLTDWIDCLTCHRSHGSDAEMTGWAMDQDDGWITDTGAEGPQIEYPGTKNSFLRLDNRGVCQQCHYK